ncbi:FAD-dependent monooxygenase [Humitalea sp. 24SJ18S-53]|uniref:FAD-dependent monooxygenase n=1 Tax=Humitalea sp. 24SJ18S-53 TaxID=3422307 RepID=UPI003D672B25
MNPDVLVVGAGPVGLTMAAELARYGVRVRIVEKAAARTDKSKALVLWSRSLELIDRMGCGAAFVAAGYKVKGVNIIAGGKPIAHITLDALPTPHAYALMLPQSETERLMEQHLNSLGVQVERQVEMTGFSATPDRVSAVLRHADGAEESLESAFLVGCDGAHSAVRHGLGMAFDGETLPSDWILADVHLAGLPVGPDELAIYWHADGVLALFPITPGRYRVIADIGDARGDGHPADPTLEQVQALMDRRGPGGITASAPVWLAGFRINERKVADYSAGRVFLAGDAAHIHSPAGGQGMNTGMQDACNLGWKLALVLRGHSAALLDSYSIERSAVGRQVLADAGRLTSVATLKGGLAQSLRNHVASLVLGLSPVRRKMTTAMAELSIGYPDSPLTTAGSPPHGGPAAGARAPVLDATDPVGAGSTPRFALFAEASAESAALIARHPGLLEPHTRPPFAAGGIWLVRPDGYVAVAAGAGDWARVGAALDRIA